MKRVAEMSKLQSTATLLQAGRVARFIHQLLNNHTSAGQASIETAYGFAFEGLANRASSIGVLFFASVILKTISVIGIFCVH